MKYVFVVALLFALAVLIPTLAALGALSAFLDACRRIAGAAHAVPREIAGIHNCLSPYYGLTAQEVASIRGRPVWFVSLALAFLVLAGRAYKGADLMGNHPMHPIRTRDIEVFKRSCK